ncbi:MAG: ABC transporter ATP-binding protein [Solirubrobacterales bacterium]
MVDPPTAPVIELRDVSRRYGVEPPVYGLRDVNLQVERGEWLSVIGPSGSGKSTLLNILGCLDQQTAGSYLFDGVDTSELRDEQRAGLRSRGIGFVFQSFHLLGSRTVVENVMIAETYRDGERSSRRERARLALERVGLGHRAEYMPPRLSGGERQRAAIARALLGSPLVLLCDEPTGNLDSVNTAAVLELFGELHEQGMTIMMITHDPDVAVKATRQVRIIDGLLGEVPR